MKILEVRDGFILIEADDSIYLSSFVRVIGMEKDYIAQINRMRSVNNIVVATAKILFVMSDGVMSNYDKTEPARDAEVEPFTLDILKNSIKISKPVITGKTFDNSGFITIDAKAFDKKMLISTDSIETNNILLRNFSKQFANIGKKTVIIDANNAVRSKKSIAGKDFKLPLNKMTLDFLYKVCYEEATNDSRPLIAEVFRDLAEYADTVSFVPFGVLKSIVDEMVDKQHIFKLFVLKNKLNFLSKAGYFADNQSEVESLKKILDADCSVIDISSIALSFQNCYAEYIYSNLSAEETQVFFELSNNISKRCMKTILMESEIPSVIVVNSRYKYLNDIKAIFDNFIIEPSPVNNTVFSVYSSFLTSMPENTYLITGEGLNYIPVISKVQIIDDVISFEEADTKQTEPAQQESAESVAEAEITESSDLQAEEIPEAEEEEEAELPSQDEIIANIEQKSDEVINSVTENLDDIQEVDLFDSDEQIEDDEIIQDETSEEDVSEEIVEISEDEEDDENASEVVIEPEYTEISEDENSDTETEEIIDETLVESDEQESVEETTQSIDDDTVIEPVQQPDAAEEGFEDTSLENDELLQEFSDNEELNEIQDLTEDGLNETFEDDNEIIPESEDDLNDISQGVEEITEESDGLQDVSTEDISIDEGFDELLEADNTEDLQLESSDEVLSETLHEDDELPADNVVPEPVSDSNDELEEIVELEPDEASADDIIIDLTDEGADNINIDEDLDRQIVEDVDKVYTTIKEPEEIEEISDSDLDLIDELNSDEGGEGELLEEYNGLEEGMLEQPSEGIIPEKQPQPEKGSPEILEKRDANTPIVPVYDADIPQEDMVVSDPIQQGDSVVHAKYGNGIVEKMIKYGTKTLYSINFENIGRRLLDPTLTEIKKL